MEAPAACSRPTPCPEARHRHGPQRCPACFNEFIAALSVASDFDRQLAADPGMEPRPTAEDTVDISPLAQLEWMAFRIGCSGEPAVGSPEYTPEQRAAFERGFAAGFAEYQAAIDEEYYADLDREPASPDEAIDPDERVNAIGVIEARKKQ